MSKKFIQNIQKLIEEKDPKKDLGLVSEGNISHFQAKPPALVFPSRDDFTPGGQGGPVEDNDRGKPGIPRSIVWTYSQFKHNRGEFADLTLENFNTTIEQQSKTITTPNGNFSLQLTGSKERNISLTTDIEIASPVTLIIRPTVNSNISLSVYIAFKNTPPVKVFTSGLQKYVNSDINLNFNQTGNWIITILLYMEKVSSTTFDLLGNLGSFVTGSSSDENDRSQPIIFNRSRGNQGFESVFIDGANGPTLSNIIYWDRFISTTASGNDRVGGQSGYGLYHVTNERLSFDVVSGWGTDAFVVSGSQLDDFPIAATIGIPGPIAVTYQVSGTAFDLGADRTIVTVSGTAFLGAKFDPIYIERTLKLTDITQDSTIGSIISGTHFNVKAGDLYTYEIDTFNRFGNRGPRSIRISGTAGDINPPGLVTSLAGTGSLKAIRLTWTNPTNIDLKGVHIWDTDTVVSGTTKPIKTIIKGSNTTIPECTVVNEVSSGTLIDQWPYKLYASTYDHAGNESTEAMPTVTVTTDVEIKTSREGQRIELDTSSNQLKFYNSADTLTLTLGEDVAGTFDGIDFEGNSVLRFNGATNFQFPTIACVHEITSNFSGPNVPTVSFRTDQLSSNVTDNNMKLIGVFGIANRSAGIAEMSAIRGDFLGTEIDNSYSGKFLGAKVFIEKDLIVSGTNGILTKGIRDTDNDTKIEVESLSDVDAITFDVAGNEIMIISGANVGFGTSGPGTRIDIKQSGSFKPTLTLENISNGALHIPFINLYNNDPSPTDFMPLSRFQFQGNSDAGTKKTFNEIHGDAEDVSDGAEAGSMELKMTLNGIMRSAIFMNGFSGTIGEGAVEINRNGVDIDFRVETENVDNGFFVDGATANVGIGTATFDGTAVGALAIANSTAPAAGTANQSYIYAKDVSSSSEMHVMDEAGNETPISPHDPETGEWQFYSKNMKTGRVVKVHMEKMIHKLEEFTGEKFMEEWFEEV